MEVQSGTCIKMNNPCHENINISTNKDVIFNTVIFLWLSFFHTKKGVACVGDGCRVAWRDGTRLVRSAPTAVGQACNTEGVDIPNGRNGESFRFKQEVRIAKYLG